MNTLGDRHIDGAISQELLKQLAYSEKMSELGRISAGVVHELNAPLSVIISATQMIMRETDMPEFVREMVARISSEALRLSQLTRRLLNFSSQEDTEPGGEADVNLTVEFVLDFLGYEAAKRGVKLLRKLDYHVPVVKIGANLLKQVLLNIIMNALQAMEMEGGSLMVETMAPGAGNVSIVIADTGPGIPAASLVRIFEPYYTTKKPGEGTGLGLFVTKRLVEGLGGSIEVRSTEGEGTTFIVTFAADEE